MTGVNVFGKTFPSWYADLKSYVSSFKNRKYYQHRYKGEGLKYVDCVKSRSYKIKSANGGKNGINFQ